MSLSCGNKQNQESVFQCQYDDRSNYPIIQQLGYADLTLQSKEQPVSIVKQFISTGRFYPAQTVASNLFGVRPNSIPSSVALDYLNVVPSEVNMYMRWG